MRQRSFALAFALALVPLILLACSVDTPQPAQPQSCDWIDCDDHNPCTRDEKVRCECEHHVLFKQACDDQDPGSTSDACDLAGQCRGKQVWPKDCTTLGGRGHLVGAQDFECQDGWVGVLAETFPIDHQGCFPMHRIDERGRLIVAPGQYYETGFTTQRIFTGYRMQFDLQGKGLRLYMNFRQTEFYLSVGGEVVFDQVSYCNCCIRPTYRAVAPLADPEGWHSYTLEMTPLSPEIHAAGACGKAMTYQHALLIDGKMVSQGPLEVGHDEPGQSDWLQIMMHPENGATWAVDNVRVSIRPCLLEM